MTRRNTPPEGTSLRCVRRRRGRVTWGWRVEGRRSQVNAMARTSVEPGELRSQQVEGNACDRRSDRHPCHASGNLLLAAEQYGVFHIRRVDEHTDHFARWELVDQITGRGGAPQVPFD